jgi:hypothetical protein
MKISLEKEKSRKEYLECERLYTSHIAKVLRINSVELLNNYFTKRT